MKKIWFVAGLMSAFTLASFANLPSSGGTSGSMATSSDVSEIRAKRHAELSFDQDLKRLSASQGRYHENLPLRGHKSNRDQIRVRQSSKKAAPKKVRAVKSQKSSAVRAAKSRV